ncbi:hypothetical protein HPB47_003137 [Ixodes persulcatus]|uniref:Uncharacterized protein n=1 Tax=Ixodes persulcatus TaxID=34615 RepID=A0AC60PKB6_IXOPE|nr:hypothetical protein HPB47_003137 [Ixodes persulcatus]
MWLTESEQREKTRTSARAKEKEAPQDIARGDRSWKASTAAPLAGWFPVRLTGLVARTSTGHRTTSWTRLLLKTQPWPHYMYDSHHIEQRTFDLDSLRRVSTQLSKYYYVVSALPPDIAEELDDVLARPYLLIPMIN